MKKIYILTAVFALLTLSLNAQTTKSIKKAQSQPKSTTEKVVTPPDGYFRMGPSRASSTPVTPPYSNSFGSNDEWNWWEAINNNNDSYTWELSNNTARIRWNSSRAADDWLVTAPITLQAGKTYKFSIKAWEGSTNYGSERLEVKMASTNTATALSNGTTIIGQTNISVLQANAVTLSNENITVTTSGNYYIGIHGISDADIYYLYVDDFVIDVEAVPEHDLGIALSAPASVGAGNTATVTATVTNAGGYAETGYTVSFFADGTLISTQTGGSLATGASATFTFDYPTTANDGGTTVNFTATVTCNDDANASNNNASASMSVFTLPAPENVVATPNNDNQSATVTWSAPSNLPTVTTAVPETVTENFDDTSVFPSFSIGGITATQHTGTIGDWTVYTPSSDYVYGPQNVTFTNDNEPQAWAVMNPTAASWNIGAAHSGEQFMISFCDAGDSNGDNIQTTNHWLISPELSGNAQTITFWERVITTQYGDETYEVLASSTDNNPASFSLVQSYTSNATSWTQRTASLPAGTKYFAIRHTAYDIFGVMIDDVTYEISHVVEAPLAPVSYNIYLDGQLVGNVDANDPLTYDFGTLAAGDHECAVSAVYTVGESAQTPATFTITPKTATPTLSMVDNGDGTYTITATAASPDTDAQVTLNVTGQQPVTGTGSASITITQTDADQPVTATATAQATDKLVSNEASENFIVPALPITPTPAITYVVNGDNVVITATGQGEVTLNVTGQDPVTGNGTVSITLPRTDANYTVTATATAQAAYHQQSAQASEEITIPFLQTEAPSITYSSDGESVTITATANEPDANAVVTLTVGNGEPVTGTGSVSVTVPCGVTSTTVTATATAKVDGKAQSETTTEQVPIPGGEGWLEMYGTYNNPNDLLSMQSLEVDEDGEHLEIMLIDQFLASTLHNDHPNGYSYTMKETINNEEKSSNTVAIPVYKTSSTMQGFYTLNQIEEDEDMHLKAQVINSEMDYAVNPDHNTLYHSLYHSGKNDAYPTIDVEHRVSQLQKYEEMDDNQVHYFFTENETEDVTPMYNHISNQTVELLDTNYVLGNYNDEISYVPVIWTFGLYTARGDGKNNSYGSDIKREKLGDVQIVNVGGSMSGANNVEDTGAGWEGLFKVGNEWYCIYTPIITVEGITPETFIQGDGDVSEYEPYLYRVWCLYPGAHNFKHVAQQNAQGQTVQVLADDGPRPAPFLLGSEQITDPNVNRVTIGRDWHNGEGPLQWSFAVPCSVSPSDVEFAVRFYYKKKVTNAQASNGLKGNRDGGDDNEYYIVEGTGNANGIPVSVNEYYAGKAVVGVTYVNSLGMKSDKPFDGLNIVVTRYSDGTTSTTKVIR